MDRVKIVKTVLKVLASKVIKGPSIYFLSLYQLVLLTFNEDVQLNNVTPLLKFFINLFLFIFFVKFDVFFGV